MFRGITLNNDWTITFKKEVFAEDEIFLANCFSFSVGEDGSTVKSDLRSTTKVALNAFMCKAFHTQVFSQDWGHWRESFYPQLKEAYQQIYKHLTGYVSRDANYPRLYKHQVDTLLLSLYKKYNLFALEQGLGKTVVAATLTRILQSKHTLIICPAVVKWQWYKEMTNKWGYDQLNFTLLDTSRSKTIRAFHEKYIIINPDILSKYMDYILDANIDHIIIDECHGFKGTQTHKFKHLKRITEHYPNARITLLSGSPVKNRINDVFAYLKLTHHPLGDNYARFLREFTTTSNFRGGIKVTGGKQLDKLSVMLSNFMIRKTKAECLDLPEKIVTKYYFELADYKNEYDTILKELAKQKDISNLTSSLHSLNIVVAKSKIKGIIDIIDGLLAQDRKVVVFSSYKEPLAMLEAHYKEVCVKIDGSVNAYKREELISKFRDDENTTVFLGNMIAAGVGINLTNASDVIFTNFPFTPTEMAQCIDRTHRIGQTNSVNAYYTVCQNSIDEQLVDLIGDKQADINALIDKGKVSMDYSSIPEQLFRTLIENFKKENGEEIGVQLPANNYSEGDGELHTGDEGEQKAVDGFRPGVLLDKAGDVKQV